MSLRQRVMAVRDHPDASGVGASAAAVLAVRGLGLVSQGVIIATFGAGRALDAFFLALIVPNFIAVPVSAGAELALAPSVTRLSQAGHRQFALFRRWALVRGSSLAAVVGLIVTVAAPLGVWISAGGAGKDARQATLELARWLYPTAGLLVLSGVASAVLIGMGRLSIPVLAQGGRPLAMLATVLWSRTASVEDLAVAVLVGSVLEAVVLVTACMLTRAGPAVGAPVGLEEEQSKTLKGMRAFVPGAAGYQVTPIVDQVVVAGLGPGILVRYLLAVRFFDVSKQVLIQPVVRVAQNRLSGAAGRATFRATLLTVLRRAVQVGVISAALLGIAAPVVILGFFTNGEFTMDDGLQSVTIVLVMAGALVPFALNITMSRALGALGRGSVGAWLMGAYTAMNVALDVILARWIGVYGVAIATVVSLGCGTLLYLAALDVRPREALGAFLGGRAVDASC